MSSEAGEDDDNMIVFLVEDEELISGDEQNIQVPNPITVKVEPLDESKSIANIKLKQEIFDEEDAENYNKKNIKEESSVHSDDEENAEVEEETAENLDSLPSQSPAHSDDDDYEIEYLDEENIKQENEEGYDVEFLEYESDEDAAENDYLSNEDNRRGKRQQPHKNKSHIDDLRKAYPDITEEELVENIAMLMRNTVPPPPPDGFCKPYFSGMKNDKHRFICTLCPKKTESQPLAARHYQFKHGEFYLTCFACGIIYRNTTNLYKHEKRCSAPDAKLALKARGRYLGRKGRGRPFTTKDKFLTAHTAELARHGRLFCTKCPASFVHRDNLEAHENSHAGVRPFLCPHCPAKYTSVPGLRRHVKALHGDEKFICDLCNAVFPLKPAIVSHMNSHRVFRKYPCKYCERRFAQKVALNHHMNKVHLNLPPAHGCPVCPKRYARMTHVREHMQRVHGLTMITRRMYLEALPKMGDLPNEILEAAVVYNTTNNEEQEEKVYKTVDLTTQPNDDEEVEQILPDVVEHNWIELDLTDNAPKDKQILHKSTKVQTNNDALISSLLNGGVIVLPTIENKNVVPKKSTRIAKRFRKVPEYSESPPLNLEPTPREDNKTRNIDTIILNKKDTKNKTVKENAQTVVIEQEAPVENTMFKVVSDIKSKLTKRKTAIKASNLVQRMKEAARRHQNKVTEDEEAVVEFLQYMKCGKVPKQSP